MKLAGRSLLSRLAWTLPPYALILAAVRWPWLGWVWVMLANVIGYMEGTVT